MAVVHRQKNMTVDPRPSTQHDMRAGCGSLDPSPG
jgi:hypothetical protein